MLFLINEFYESLFVVARPFLAEIKFSFSGIIPFCITIFVLVYPINYGVWLIPKMLLVPAILLLLGLALVYNYAVLLKLVIALNIVTALPVC